MSEYINGALALEGVRKGINAVSVQTPLPHPISRGNRAHCARPTGTSMAFRRVGTSVTNPRSIPCQSRAYVLRTRSWMDEASRLDCAGTAGKCGLWTLERIDYLTHYDFKATDPTTTTQNNSVIDCHRCQELRASGVVVKPDLDVNVGQLGFLVYQGRQFGIF